jgi:hypothetical protein
MADKAANQFCRRTRREFLWESGAGFGALGLTGLFANSPALANANGGAVDGKAVTKFINPMAPKKPMFPAKAKAVIFLHQWGGPGQHETFDPKPDAPDNVRGWYGATKTKLPGVILGEKIPRIAALADKLTVVRCMQHSMKNHNSAGYYSLTGVAPATDDQRLRDSIDLFPAYGSIVDKLAPAPKGVATFVAYPHVIADGSITPFEIEPTRRRALLEGLDGVGMALARADEIRAFEARHFARSPWLGPTASA